MIRYFVRLTVMTSKERVDCPHQAQRFRSLARYRRCFPDLLAFRFYESRFLFIDSAWSMLPAAHPAILR